MSRSAKQRQEEKWAVCIKMKILGGGVYFVFRAEKLLSMECTFPVQLQVAIRKVVWLILPHLQPCASAASFALYLRVVWLQDKSTQLLEPMAN